MNSETRGVWYLHFSTSSGAVFTQDKISESADYSVSITTTSIQLPLNTTFFCHTEVLSLVTRFCDVTASAQRLGLALTISIRARVFPTHREEGGVERLRRARLFMSRVQFRV